MNSEKNVQVPSVRQHSSNEMLAAADVKDSTHLLLCKHCIGTRCIEYTMYCKLIGVTKNGLCKIIVFGDRNWKDKDHIKRIKYVSADRLVAYDR